MPSLRISLIIFVCFILEKSFNQNWKFRRADRAGPTFPIWKRVNRNRRIDQKSKPDNTWLGSEQNHQNLKCVPPWQARRTLGKSISSVTFDLSLPLICDGIYENRPYLPGENFPWLFTKACRKRSWKLWCKFDPKISEIEGGMSPEVPSRKL